jgi:hypothetical protein
MNDAFDIERTRQLLTTGRLPGWAGLLLFVLLGAAVCWHLHRELAGSPARVVVRVFLALRLAVVGLAVWLLCKPVLLVIERWRERPHLITLTTAHPSLGVRENFGGAHHSLDVLESLEQRTIQGRTVGASAVGRALERLAATLDEGGRRAASESEHIASALPPRPDFTNALPVLKNSLLAAREELARRQTLLPAKLADDKLTATRDAASGRLQAFAGAIQAAAGEVDLIQTQGAAFPELFEKFAGRLDALAKDARRLAGEWGDLQAALDESAAAASPPMKAAMERTRTRRDFASAGAERIAAQDGVRVTNLEAPSLADGLRSALRTGGNPPTAIVVLDDGTAALTPAARDGVGNVSDAGVAVHAALIGADGFDPPDAGIISVECPGVVVAGQRVVARVLVKARLAKGVSAKLIASAGETVLAQAGTSASAVVELPLRFDAAGRQSVVFELQTSEPDAHPGNQTFATVVDVVAKPLRVLVVSDTMNSDFVLVRGVCERLPQLRLDSILLDPQLGKFSVGADAGQFPGTPEQWQSVSAVALLGRPNATISTEALAGMKAAIDAGLKVLVVQSSADEGWLPTLGLAARSVASAARTAPRADAWQTFYALGRDEAESRESWAHLPAPSAGFAPVPTGIPLVAGSEDALLQLISRGRGGILFAGVPSLASLRADGNASTINRLVAGLLEAAARPWFEGDSGVFLFPAQPVAGRKQLAAFGGPPPADLKGAALTTESWLAANGSDITFTMGALKFRRPVHQLLAAGDFELTSRAAPLVELSGLGHGRFVPLVDLPELLNDLHLAPAERQHVSSYRLWPGGWPLAALLLIVSAEYLLRRRAGRVM